MYKGSSFRNLRVWGDAMDLVQQVFSVSSSFPASELYGLTAQVRRSAVSVPSNIAEAVGRLTKGEKRQFLGIARGSLNEVRTQMEIALRLNYIDRAAWESFEAHADLVSRGLAGLLNWAKGA
jgi:four helix bundle protein